jgi:glycosyltransferase involved in cell wall biosynthesis
MSDEERNAMGERARDTIRSDFSWDRVATAITQALKAGELA